MSRLKKIGITAAILFFGFAGYRLTLMYQMMHTVHSFPPMVVSTVEAKKQKISPFISSVGTLKAVNAVTITPEVAGTVASIHYTSGQKVKKGDLLVHLNDEAEQADLQRYQASLKLASLSLERSASLTSKHIEAQASYDQKKAKFNESQAQVNQAQAIINRKLVRAPFAGTVGIDHINIGQYIQAGTPIVNLTDLASMQVKFTVPEQDFPALKIGQTVWVKVDAFPQDTIKAVLSSIDSQIDPDTRMVEVQATFSNPDQTLTPGMFATVQVEMLSQGESIIIPETAIDYTLYGTTAYVVAAHKDDKTGQEKLIAEQRNIVPGKSHRGFVEVVKGLKAGEQVVIAGQIKLENGAPVMVNNDVQLKVKDSYLD